jgi:hypothetical protein
MPSVPPRMIVSTSNELKEIAALLTDIQVVMIGHHDPKYKIACSILTHHSKRLRLYQENQINPAFPILISYKYATLPPGIFEFYLTLYAHSRTTYVRI